jgi:poly(A) polymerase
LEQPQGAKFVEHALAQTDTRIRQEKSISPSFLFACLLWPQVSERWAQQLAKGEHSYAGLMRAIDSVLDDQADELAIQKRIVVDMREIWTMQPRFERRQGATPHRLLEHLRFRSGYDFMLLRSECDEVDTELAQWWTEFQAADNDSREDMIRNAPTAPRQGNKGSGTGPGGQKLGAPKRRRRRRTGQTQGPTSE